MEVTVMKQSKLPLSKFQLPSGSLRVVKKFPRRVRRRLKLSEFRLPFGSLRVDPSDVLVKMFPSRVKRHKDGARIQHEGPSGYTVQYEIDLKGMQLGDVIQSDRGISYLDW